MLVEKITPEELSNLIVSYSFVESQFGNIVVASTRKGVCYLGFTDEQNAVPEDLRRRFSKAKFIRREDVFQEMAVSALAENNSEGVIFHLKCTDFQLEVWQELMKTRVGELSTYGDIAQKINHPKASRAVGTAVGANPIAVLIPCHRVILSSGTLGNYRWGKERKTALIEWEKSVHR